jgi:ribA/ribD-fused uncharacterized protein
MLARMDTPLDLQRLRRAVRDGWQPRYRFFWGHRGRRDGRLSDACFSQWWPCTFTVEGLHYTSAEQFMMAGKARIFGDQAAFDAIRLARDPAQIKALGRRVAGFDEATWAAAREDLVTTGNVAKFGQDPALRGYLRATGDDVLVEASPVDAVWGIGLAADDPRARDPDQWPGLNLLGFALMRARAELG